MTDSIGRENSVGCAVEGAVPRAHAIGDGLERWSAGPIGAGCSSSHAAASHKRTRRDLLRTICAIFLLLFETALRTRAVQTEARHSGFHSACDLSNDPVSTGAISPAFLRALQNNQPLKRRERHSRSHPAIIAVRPWFSSSPLYPRTMRKSRKGSVEESANIKTHQSMAG